MSTNEDKKGKGHFVATPLEFECNGQTYKYAGRGRWSVQLATVVMNQGKAPERQKDGTWGWRDAKPEELASAEKLVNKIAAKLLAKADAAAKRLAARAAKKASKTVPVEAASTEAPAKV
jgi:hypothetical protein